MPGVPITPLTGRLAIVAMLIVLAAMASLTRGGATQSAGAGQTSNAAYLNQSRTDMIAGCRDQGAPRSYCECVTDEVLERNGRNVARLRALASEVAGVRPGAAPPRLLAQASQACSRAGS